MTRGLHGHTNTTAEVRVHETATREAHLYVSEISARSIAEIGDYVKPACRPRPAKGEAPLKRGRGQAGPNTLLFEPRREL